MDQKTLQISLPRLVQGPGSLIRLDLMVSIPANITTSKVIAYSTFDQGSSKAEISFEEDKKPIPFSDQFTQFFDKYLSSTSIFGIISTFVTILIGFISMYIFQQKRKKEKKPKKFDWEEY